MAVWAYQRQVFCLRFRGAIELENRYSVMRFNKAFAKFSESIGEIECTGFAFQLPGLGQLGRLHALRQAPVSLKLTVQSVRLAPFWKSGLVILVSDRRLTRFIGAWRRIWNWTWVWGPHTRKVVPEGASLVPLSVFSVRSRNSPRSCDMQTHSPMAFDAACQRTWLCQG